MATIDFLKPYALELAKDVDGGTGEITSPNTEKADLISDIDGRLENMRAGMQADYPANYTDFYNDVYLGFKASVDARLDAIPDNNTVSYDTALEEVKQEYVLGVQEDRPYDCPQCGTEGLIPVYNPDGSDTGNLQECPTCSGYGYTVQQYKRNPYTDNYILA